VEHKKAEKITKPVKTETSEQEDIDRKIKYYYGEQSTSGDRVKSGSYEKSVADFMPGSLRKEVKPTHKWNKWIWIPSVLLFLIICCFGLYLFCSPVNKMMNNWFCSRVTKVPEEVVIPNDTAVVDTASVAKPVDSLQILFDSPRVFTKFIGSERLRGGSRLTQMAKRYYGASDFWVYIYEANKDRFSDPDKIPAHSLIKIPKVDPRLIDANNPRCINKARELHDLYVK
jgi:hypothetical protein